MNKLKNEIIAILEGIDKTETEDEQGWWETSKGAEFGAKKLQQILSLITSEKEFKEQYEIIKKEIK